jgi:hypothetical protein
MFAILLLCLVGLTLAQQPVPCTSPSQWEARLFDTNEEQNLVVVGRLSYDATYHRERIIDEVDEGTQVDNYDTVALFDLKVEFIYNFKARNCTRREITRAWRDFGVRANDTSYGEAYIGSSAVPGANVLVTIWGGNFTTPQNDTIGFVSAWTYLGCIPVSRTSFSQRLGVSHLSFYDVTAGISDPNVFIPRRECLTAEEWENRYTLFGTPSTKNI